MLLEVSFYPLDTMELHKQFQDVQRYLGPEINSEPPKYEKKSKLKNQ